jgi:hypothetical protein
MFSKVNLLWLIVVLLLPLSTQAGQGEYKYIVSGRVVGQNGQPVVNARIALRPTDRQSVLTEAHASSDVYGKFRCVGVTARLVNKQILYVTSPPPAKALFPIRPPFDQLNSSEQPFTGRAVFVNPGQELDVGDVPVQVQYNTVTIYLRDQAGNPLLTKAEDWWDVRVRVRDARGDSIAVEGLSEDEIKENVDTDNSALRVALPQGSWGLEVSLEGLEGPWLTSGTPILVGKPDNSLQVVLKQTAGEDQSSSRINSQRKTYSAEEARRELKRMGIEFSEKSFLERVNMQNAQAVGLFLDAGMNPNVRDDDGRTPLISATMPGDVEIVKMLIDRGADVNAKENDGGTALMSAATGGFATIVKILLAHGADVNAQHKNGVTALMCAIGNVSNSIEIVKDLLAAGADVNLKTKSGHTALTDAKETGDQEIIRLLEEAQHKRN